MIAPITYQRTFHVDQAPPGSNSSELSRVFAAAVVNQQFREMLLRDPLDALQKGYMGERFLLSKEEWELIISIRAESLPDLAQQVNRSLRIGY
jgi:hypothetical protein